MPVALKSPTGVSAQRVLCDWWGKKLKDSIVTTTLSIELFVHSVPITNIMMYDSVGVRHWRLL